MNSALRMGAASALGTAMALVAQAAVAAPRGEHHYVTAVSRYGNGTLTAPVRPARYGYEVQLPGGVWIHCAANCADTLRRQKLDFWETRNEEGGDNNWND